MKQAPNVLALDLEGTLISDAISLIPRPGLYDFLCKCSELFPRIIVYTAVNQVRFREVSHFLVQNKHAPIWFKEVEYLCWRQKNKDLSLIPNIQATEAILVDDFLEVAHPDQKSQFLQIKHFEYPYLETDSELLKIAQKLEKRVSAYS